MFIQGSEAILTESFYKNNKVIVKKRIEKKYRQPELDIYIITKRTITEARLLKKAKENGLNVPQVFYVNKNNYEIYLEYIEGATVKFLFFLDTKNNDFGKQIGFLISNLHNLNIIHGDLTTSNMLVKDSTVFLIDFGLGYSSNSIEDKAVDIFLLERTFLCTHPNKKNVLDGIMDYYSKHTKDADKILKRVEIVRSRGRKK